MGCYSIFQLRDSMSNSPKYHEARAFSCIYDIKLDMDSFQENATQQEEIKLDSVSD